MLIRAHRETGADERRVALTPRATRTLIDAGHRVTIPAGAGAAAGFPDEAYADAGATITEEDPDAADLLVAVGPIGAKDVGSAAAVIAMLDPLGSPDEVAAIAETGATAFALELIPRTTLAQTMDVLSSQATIAGYQAVLLAASELPRLFPMMMTAAGTVRPARVLVLGAGVAGLQAIATARRLGAVVSGYDIRPAAQEQIESLGATFVGGPLSQDAAAAGGYAGEVDEETRAAQQVALAEAVADADAVITTAQVPGRRAPLLVTASMVESMRPGSLIVDLAASTGGNCEVTSPGETVTHHGVAVHGPLDLASRTAADASEMFARNVVALIEHLVTDGEIVFNEEDEISSEVCVARDGKVVSRAVLDALGAER